MAKTMKQQAAATQKTGVGDVLTALVASHDVKRVQATIEAQYGFTPPALYCHDLIAFMDASDALNGTLARRIVELESLVAELEKRVPV